MLSSAGVCRQVLQVAQRHSHDLCRFSLPDVPSWWRRQLHDVCAVGKVKKFARRQLMQFLLCSIPHCGLLFIEDDLLCVSPCSLPACHFLLDSRLLGLTLRCSAPVLCYRVSWTRGRLALAQEAVRVSPSVSFGLFCSW